MFLCFPLYIVYAALYGIFTIITLSLIHISCGRLMCCLAYEQKSYEYLNSITPQAGSIVRTPDGEGTVIEVNVVAGTLKVRSNVEILAPRIYKREECVYLRGGKRAPKAPDKEDE